jgi:hypothetical protein
MNRRTFLARLSAAAAFVTLNSSAFLMGCGKISQQSLAVLAQTLGTSMASLASLLGSSTIAAKINSITTAVVADIQSWVKGSPTDDIIQLLGDLETQIGLIVSNSVVVAALIELALGTIQGILAAFPPAAAAVMARTKGVRVVKLAKVPHVRSEYAAQFNAIVQNDPKFAKLAIQP